MSLEQLLTAVRRLAVLAGLVERYAGCPQLRGVAVDRGRQGDPRVASRVVPRFDRRRKGRVREGADRNDEHVGLLRFCVEDLGAAVRAEVEDVLLPVRLVGDSLVVADATDDVNLVRLVTRLYSARP